MTIMVMFIATLLTTVVLTDGIEGLPLARHAQDYQTALQAADAGVEDYINRLDSNATYWQLTSDPSNPALSGWTPVPGTATGEWFRYAVNDANTARTGVVHLVVSGASGVSPVTDPGGAVIRTIDVGIAISGFTSFLYYTDYEIVDPLISGYPQSCQLHAWEANGQGGYGPPAQCSGEKIYFVSGDTLNGPVFSNDEFNICGSPSFPYGATSAYDQNTSLSVSGQTSYGGAGAYNGDPGCSNNPSFNGQGTQPAGAGDSPFPATNTNMESDLGSSNAGGGCGYSGPITVTFSVNHGTGEVTVTLGTGGAVTANPPGLSCTGTFALSSFNGLIYDENNTAPGCWRNCTASVSVQGTVAGQVTVGSQNNITITGNLVDNNASGTDIIGLSATNSIIIEHGNNCDGSPWPSGCLPNLTIDAAMVALDHSIYVNNWSSGNPMGTLTVYGSLAQKFRGPVGTFYANGQIASGYEKSYSWDSRLRFEEPPYFTTPTLPNWSKATFAECGPVPVPTATSC